MKKVLTLVSMLLVMGVAMAQLAEPKVTVKEPQNFSQVYYNGIKLARADWPATKLTEDALSIQVGNHVYTIAKFEEVGDMHFRYEVVCNGKKSKMEIQRGKNIIYTIGNYKFVVETKAEQEHGSKDRPMLQTPQRERPGMQQPQHRDRPGRPGERTNANQGSNAAPTQQGASQDQNVMRLTK